MSENASRISETENQFRELVESFCAEARARGIEIPAHTPEAWRHFRKLTRDQQKKKVESLVELLGTSFGEDSAATEPSGTKAALRRALQVAGLQHVVDVFDRINDSDVVEIYSLDGTQLFRNLRFLELCSYSLVDLYSREWFELFRRPQTITTALQAKVAAVLSSDERKTVPADVPDHFLEETSSPELFRFFIRQKILSPLWDSNGEIRAILGTLEAERVGNDKDGLNVRPLSK